MLTTSIEDLHPGEHSDAELMRLARSGDIDAFQVVYARHDAAARVLASQTVGDPDLTADVMRDAFISLWRSTASYFSETESVRDWMLRVTVRTADKALVQQPSESEGEPSAPHPGVA